MPRSKTAVAAAILSSALLASCGGGHSTRAGQENAVTPSGKHITLRTPGVPKGEQRVRLKVVAAKGRDTIALVPVYVNGRGPYPFALDTGASQSLIDSTGMVLPDCSAPTFSAAMARSPWTTTAVCCCSIRA